MERQQEEQGEFNQAIAYLYRLDAILKNLNEASFNNDYAAKHQLLKVFYKELYPMMNDTDRKLHNEMAWVVNEKYKIYEWAIRVGKKKIPIDAIQVLDMWDIELRDCMNKKGMLMPKKSDPRFALASK